MPCNDKLSDRWPTVTLGGKETMEQPESNNAAERASGSMERMVRPVLRKSVTLKANLTACTLTMYDAREQIANELRRIADMVEEGDTLSESGNMGICYYGSWELPDPWEGPNVAHKPSGDNPQ